ncbi:hypothetical protein FHX42_004483 [Saccharopolyspora lacisalsi]|uniref:Uncharacterized protein n=1 Tax=Halosaccharopolyspora lacisalsi TaxID=1000566 RepID=A0A839E2J4_9PSEU|nr:hypothetical protein [Halosaccharopolyspora lacisalsi]MBA8827099.1 hypothetical protein [Halosaccharopolyspora lacisalsi]
MGLFDPEPAPVKHKIYRRSWWDGSVTAWCGNRAPAGAYRETWLTGGTTCPACIQAKKQHRK